MRCLFNNTIVISAVNLVEGGTLSILKKFLQELSEYRLKDNYKIYVLVHSKNLLPYYKNMEYIEYPMAKKNWLIRIFYEYVYFLFLSIRYRPLIWISLHDMTPNVIAKYQYVYMHNPSPFFMKQKNVKISFKFRLFVSLYKYVYRINVRKNTAVIVQQNWLRDKIAELCKIPKEKIIVAYPEYDGIKNLNYDGLYNKNQFFFNSFPREFKNFEVICKAAEILNNSRIKKLDWNIYLTIDGTENNYSRNVVEKYKNNPHIHFIGLITREKCEEYYRSSEVLIFPSLLETWGLPISEFKLYNKKMIIADLPYAHETANGANLVHFFKPTDENSLAKIMEEVITGQNEAFFSVPTLKIQAPFCLSWETLFKLIIE